MNDTATAMGTSVGTMLTYVKKWPHTPPKNSKSAHCGGHFWYICNVLND
jgi:hypothetical protein